MNTLNQTSVRVALNTDFTVHADKKGLTFGNSVITWGWIEKAKASVLGNDLENSATAPKGSQPKPARKSKAASTAKI